MRSAQKTVPLGASAFSSSIAKLVSLSAMADPYILLPMDYYSGSISRVGIWHFARLLLLLDVCSFVKTSGGERQILRAVIVGH